MTVLVVAVVSLLYWFSRPTDNSIVVRNSIAPLLEQADDLEAQPVGTLTDSVKLFEDSLRTADQLLEFEETLAVDRGAELKLKTLSTWQSLNMKNQVYDAGIIEDLESSSREFINSRNRRVGSYAKVGLTLVRLREYLAKSNANSFPDILDQFKLVSGFADSDLGIAKNLMTVSHVFQQRGFADEAKQLFRTINLSCAASHNPEIVAIGTEARQFVSDANSLLSDLKAALVPGQKVDFETIRKTINLNTREDTVSTAGMESILDFLDYLAGKSEVETARTLLQEISKPVSLVPAGVERQSVRKKYDDVKKRLDYVGFTFQYEGLYTLDGDPALAGNFQGKNKMVVFWSPQNQQSVDFIRELPGTSERFKSQDVQILAVAVVGGENEFSSASKIAAGISGCEFLALPRNKPDSVVFSRRLPLPSLPYWVMVDRFNVVRALNVTLKPSTGSQ